MMEACARGFSYMADAKIEVPDLQFIEGSELERTWRSSQRERARQREQKIWEEFVSEQDAVTKLCKDDPYQFLEQLPEEYLRDLMQRRFRKIKKEEEIEATINLEDEVDGQDPKASEDKPSDVQLAMTIAEDGQDCDMFHIFDDDNEENYVSGPEDEVLNESMETPCTVRENNEEQPPSVSNTSSEFDRQTRSGKTENVSSLIESSIYCAKVKDLRLKIKEELESMIACTKNKILLDIEREDLVKMKKRSTEFCSRFNRIHMYQLQRQVHDLNRHNSQSLPFAKHTQFQSQMVRVVSLHQNILQALQVFHKSMDQTWLLPDSAAALLALTQLVREADDTCKAVACPQDLATAGTLYDDEALATCDRLDGAVKEYSARIDEVLSNFESTANNQARVPRSYQTKGPLRGRKKLNPYASKSSTKSNAESKLSMYALDARPSLRLNLNPKQSVSKENHHPSGTSIDSKKAASVTTANSNNKAANGNSKNKEPKSSRKTPRSRRPLMRAPAPAAGPRQPRPRESDIHTMVEAVAACKSSHVSEDGSPKHSDYFRSPKSIRSKDSTPRPLNLTPRSNKTNPSPRSKESPRMQQRDKTPRNVKLTPLRGLKPLNVVGKEGGLIKSTVKALPPAVKPVIPEEPVDLDPALGTIRVQTRLKTPRDAPLAADYSPRKKEMESECEVSRILKSLCGDTIGSRGDRVSGAKNAQLICISNNGSRQASTPQLLKILEETIQKKTPRQLINQKPLTPRQKDRLRLAFSISEQTAESLFQYRTRFVQHMLASPMYANSAIGKPWEVIGSVSDKIIDELLLKIAKEMQIQDVIRKVYDKETC